MKTIVGIFAHPDDEAFGPSGTIAKLAKENNVHLICATNGDAAKGKPDSKLGEIRQEELRKSAHILGVKDVFFLNYPDGELRNNIYHEVADKIKSVIKDLRPEIIITIEPRGVSGHIDHIFISMVSSYVFERTSSIKEIWYSCISNAMRNLFKRYFIYIPPGYKKEEVDKIVDVKDVWHLKRKAMLQHKSQIKDALSMLAIETFLAKEEYFLVWKRK